MDATFYFLWINFILIKGSSFECSNRLEFQEEIMQALPYLRNCTTVRELYPICRHHITVMYSIHPPYVVVSKGYGSQPIGLLPDILQAAMNVCCHGCANITFIGPVNSIRKFTNSNITLFMPLGSSFDSKTFFNNDYVPFLKVKSVSFLAKEMKNKAAEYTRHLMNSVLNTWPLFITAILMAVIAGCVMWVLDTWFNKADFPQTFPRGPFEGFWWAFVSMTTVGYGDRAPKSFIARIFAIIWILLGITIFSMYTAVLTSAITSKASMFEFKDFTDKKVGVLGFTAAGASAVYDESSTLVKYGNISDMAKALNKDTIHALALDDHIAMYYMQYLHEHEPTLRVHHRLKNLINSYGVLSYNKNMTTFLRSFFVTNADQRHAMMAQVIHKHWPNMKPIKSNELDTTTFFNAGSTIFYSTIIGLVAMGAVAIILGLTCKYFFEKDNNLLERYMNCIKMKYKPKEKVKPTQEQAGVKPLQMVQQVTISNLFNELAEFQSRWERQLRLSNNSDSSTGIHTNASSVVIANGSSPWIVTSTNDAKTSEITTTNL